LCFCGHPRRLCRGALRLCCLTSGLINFSRSFSACSSRFGGCPILFCCSPCGFCRNTSRLSSGSSTLCGFSVCFVSFASFLVCLSRGLLSSSYIFRVGTRLFGAYTLLLRGDTSRLRLFPRRHEPSPLLPYRLRRL